LEPRIIHLPKVEDDRGNLSFLQNEQQIPFLIKRVYWIYDVPGGGVRGGHAYRKLNEVVIALSGSFDIVLHDGTKEMRFSLNRSYYGLYIPNKTWRHLENFSTNAVALVVANAPYDEQDYLRNFDEFQQYAAK
jgi:dTDP-4-dehydrorhamnose 3,5-epimerase-like enzyme